MGRKTTCAIQAYHDACVCNETDGGKHCFDDEWFWKFWSLYNEYLTDQAFMDIDCLCDKLEKKHREGVRTVEDCRALSAGIEREIDRANIKSSVAIGMAAASVIIITVILFALTTLPPA